MYGWEGGKESVGWTMNATDRLGARLVWLAALSEKGDKGRVRMAARDGGNSFLNHYLGALYIITWVFLLTFQFFITIIKLISFTFSY